MFSSQSVLRRYTPPTCTLEIMAQGSPLSRWVGQPVLKRLRFKLSLDDPQAPEDRWVTVRGDRVQLEALHQVVEGYVQDLLERSPLSRKASLISAAPPRLEAIGQDSSASSLSIVPAPGERTPSVSLSPEEITIDISLHPEGPLTHRLHLGSLAADAPAASVRLTTLQLFDLASALDEFATDAVTLPDLERPPAWLSSPPHWARTAAIVLLTVGVTTSVVKVMDGSNQPTPTTASQGASSQDQQQISLAPPTIAPSPTNKLASPAPLTSGQKLPPPPPPGSSLPTIPVPESAPVNPVVPPGNPTVNRESAQRVQPGQPSVSRSIQTGQPAPAQVRPALRPEIAAQPNARSSAASEGVAAGGATLEGRDNTAFDTIPQVAEARRYFQQRWQPPAELTQTLEYTLELAPDGTIQRINPLGLAAGTSIDRTGIPLLGEPFVSPIPGGRSARIRAVFFPDGRVQTFLESTGG